MEVFTTSLETITGNLRENLRDAYKLLQPGTMLHVDELMNERRTNEELRNQWFYTADGEVYFLDGVSKTPTLAITREAHNPVLQNIDDAFEQLMEEKNYRPGQADVQQALAAPDTVLIALPSLRLSDPEHNSKSCLFFASAESYSEYNSEFKFLAIGTTPAEYNKLNDEERKFAERVYGVGDDFVKNMKMQKDAGISENYIWILNPDYVQKHAEEGAIARVSRLRDFGEDFDFYTGDRYIGDHYSVRGVRQASVSEQEAPAGCGAQKNGL